MQHLFVSASAIFNAIEIIDIAWWSEILLFFWKLCSWRCGQFSLVVFTVISFVSSLRGIRCNSQTLSCTQKRRCGPWQGLSNDWNRLTCFKFLFGRSFVPLTRPLMKRAGLFIFTKLYIAKWIGQVLEKPIMADVFHKLFCFVLFL